MLKLWDSTTGSVMHSHSVCFTCATVMSCHGEKKLIPLKRDIVRDIKCHELMGVLLQQSTVECFIVWAAWNSVSQHRHFLFFFFGE